MTAGVKEHPKPGKAAFLPGDTVRQTHQTGAPIRLVVAQTSDPDVVTTWDAEQGRLINVLVWGHTLVHPATAETEAEAKRRLAEHVGPIGGVLGVSRL